MNELSHASFFSGAGGLDLGLERAGWRTVSFSEIDPYASAVLAERWPGVPNLGDIVELDRRQPDIEAGAGNRGSAGVQRPATERDAPRVEREPGDWRDANLWTGGFPCQDLSVAGKRRGMGAGTRSGLAFSFLELVGRHRPRFVLLENVPGLLSSHAGRDFGTLLATLVELGYGVGYRVLDARYFGVPQRRRRVFILGDSLGGRAGAERAAEVLSVGSRCRRHPPTGVEAGADAAERATPSVDGPRLYNATAAFGDWAEGDEAGTLSRRDYKSPNHLIGPSPDSRRVRETDGLARGSHDRDGLADTLRVGGRASGAGDSYDNTPWVVNALDQRRGGADDNEAQAGHLIAGYMPARTLERDGSVSETFAPRDISDALHGPTVNKEPLMVGSFGQADDPLPPQGLDSHRYRCCGNGVVADVGEYIGRRLAEIA